MGFPVTVFEKDFTGSSTSKGTCYSHYLPWCNSALPDHPATSRLSNYCAGYAESAGFLGIPPRGFCSRTPAAVCLFHDTPFAQIQTRYPRAERGRSACQRECRPLQLCRSGLSMRGISRSFPDPRLLECYSRRRQNPWKEAVARRQSPGLHNPPVRGHQTLK